MFVTIMDKNSSLEIIGKPLKPTVCNSAVGLHFLSLHRQELDDKEIYSYTSHNDVYKIIIINNVDTMRKLCNV